MNKQIILQVKHLVAAVSIICIFVSFSVVRAAVSSYADGIAIGGTTLSTGLLLDVTGKIGATEYCDETGANCVDIAATGNLGGSGTTNYVPKFTGPNTIGNGTMRDISNQVGIGVNPSRKLDVNGNMRVRSGHVYLGADGNQDLYGDNGAYLYFDSNHSTATGLIMRDAENTVYGRIHGDGNAANFGLLDSDGQWAIRHLNNNYTEFRSNNGIVFDVGPGGVAGNYGTVSTEGGGKGGWEGYSINGRMVFMHDGNNASGIYNDVDNEWMIYMINNGGVRLRYNNNDRLETLNDGVIVSGSVRATQYCDENGANCVDASVPLAINATEDVYGAQTAGSPADTCNGDEINTYTCTVTTNQNCTDRYRIGYACGKNNGNTCYTQYYRTIDCKLFETMGTLTP